MGWAINVILGWRQDTTSCALSQEYINECLSLSPSVADPGKFPGSDFFHPGSRIPGWRNPGPRFRIRIKELKYFWLKNKIPGVHPGSRILDLEVFHSRSRIQIPDPAGVKKAQDTGSGSATLLSLVAFDKKQLKWNILGIRIILRNHGRLALFFLTVIFFYRIIMELLYFTMQKN